MSSGIKPFIVLNASGGVETVLQTNDKGYKKSIENSLIWAVNSETERLLPEDRLGRAGGFRERPGWYEAVIAADTDGERAEQDERKPAGGGITDGKSIIERLYNVIEKRKKEMPEGSYTTHLFNSGVSKIKKKTGEEAIELLLAEERGEIIYEAADLLYHLLVFLAAVEIKPEDIFKELESRE